MDRLAKANRMRWYGQVLRRDSDDVMRRALDFEVFERKRRGRIKMTRRGQMITQVEEIEQKKENTLDRSKWRNDVNKHSRNMM